MNKDKIFFSMEETGLAMNVAIIPKDLNDNLPYVFIQNDYEEKQTDNQIKMHLDGTVIGDTKPVFEEEVELQELKEWLEINKLLILMYWTGVETDMEKLTKLMKTLKIIQPRYNKNFNKDWKSTRIIHAKPLEEYFNSISDKIIGKTIDNIFYTGILYNWYWDECCEYKNGEWYEWGCDEKINEPAYYQWKESNVSLRFDSPVILDFEGARLEIMYWSGSLVNVNINSIDTDKYGANMNKHFMRNIIGQKLVDIVIHKTKHVYFMNFSDLGIERKDGDDMFEQIWFIFENGFKLELTTDGCDYTLFSEVPNYVEVSQIYIT